MAGPGGSQVGQVYIRVVPEAAGFRRRLDAQLRQELAGYKKDVPVSAELTKGSREKIKSQLAGIQETANVNVEVRSDKLEAFQKRMLSDAGGYFGKLEAKIPVTPDGEKFLRDTREVYLELVKEIQKPISPNIRLAAAQKARVLGEVQALKQLMEQGDVRIGVRAELDEFQQRALADVKKSYSAIEEKIPLTVDGERWRADLKAAVKAAEELVSVEIPVDAKEAADARGKINRIASEWKIAASRVELPIIPKLDVFQEKLLADVKAVTQFVEAKVPITGEGQQFAADVRFMADSLERTIKVKLPVEPELRAAAMAKTLAEVEAFRLRTSKAASRDFGFTLPNFAGLGQGLKNIATGAASGLPSLLSFKGILIALIAVIALLLPPVLALAAGLITLAPSFLAMLVPIGAVALGLDGIKNAAKSVQPEFDALRQTMSDTFEKGLPGMTSFTEQLQRLKGGFFNTLTAELPKVAQGVTSLLEGLVNAVTSERGLGNIRNIINNVAEGLNRAAPGVERFTSGLLQLISGISEKFPGLGKWFSDLGTKFDKWAERFTTLKDNGGLTGLERLINGVRTGLEGLTGVFQAFWNQGFKDIQDPSFGDGMKNFFDSVRDFVANTLPALSEGFKSIAGILDNLAPVFNALGIATNGIESVFDPGGAVGKMLDRAKAVKDSGGSFWDQIKAGIFETGTPDPFKGLPEKAKQAGSQSKVEFDKGFNGGVPGQPGNLPPLVNQDTSWWDSLKTKFSTGITELKTTFTGLWTSIKTSAAMTFASLGVTVTTWFNNFKATLISLPATIGASLGALAGSIFNTIVLTLSNLPIYISTAFSTIPMIIGNALSGMASTIRMKGGEAVGEVSTWPGRFIAALGNLAGTLIDSGTQLVQGLITSIITKVGEVTAELSTWPGRFRDAVGDLSGTLVDAGVQLVAGFLSGFISKAGDALAQVGEWASRLGGAAREALGINSPSRVFMEIGEGVGEGLIKGIDKQSGSTIETVRALMLAMRDVFGSAEGVNFNFNFGGGMPSGLNTQMASVATSAQTFQTSMEGAATSLTPLSSGDIKEQIDALSQQLLDLEIQRKQLMAQKYAGADKNALKAQLDQIAAQKNALGLQKDQLNYQLKYGGAVNQTTQGYQDQIKSLQQMPLDFATANANQFMTDLGWSGQGMIPSLLQQGLDMGTNFVFNVANMDDALSGQRVLQNRTAQATLGR